MELKMATEQNKRPASSTRGMHAALGLCSRFRTVLQVAVQGLILSTFAAAHYARARCPMRNFEWFKSIGTTLINYPGSCRSPLLSPALTLALSLPFNYLR